MPDGGITELKKLVEEGNKTFHDFKETNDARLKELEARGTVTPEMQASMDKADKAVDELKVKLDDVQNGIKRELEELELRFGRSGLNGAGEPTALEKQASAFFSITNKARLRPGDKRVDTEAYVAYVDAFDALLRAECNLDMLPAEIRNALSVGSDRDGGYLVPTEMSAELVRRIYETSPMRQIARVITIGAPAWEAPYKASQFTSGGWVGEKQSRSSTATGTVGMQRIETHEQYSYPEVTQGMLDDGMFDVSGFVTEEAEDVMSRTENTGFVSGNGVMQPRGFLDYKTDAVTTDDATRAWGVLQYVITNSAGGFPKISGSVADDAGSLIDVMAKLNPVYRQGAVWTMARSAEATIRKLRDADGRYLVAFGQLGDGVFGFSLHGHPIVNLEDMPVIASDSFSVAFGNFMRGYYIIDRIGFRVLRDPYTNKPYVGFYITKRTGGDVRNFDAIKLLKFGTS